MEDCRLEIMLEDRPGALSHVLDVIAKNRGNLFSVSHLREKAKDGSIPVIITLQASAADYSKIISGLEEARIEITEKRIGAAEELQLTREFILIGHVIDRDIRDTIYKICGNDVMVKSLDISLKSLKDPSAVFAEIAAKSDASMASALKKLEKIAEEKELLLVGGIE
jgi:ACT domain-containing protein